MRRRLVDGYGLVRLCRTGRQHAPYVKRIRLKAASAR